MPDRDRQPLSSSKQQKLIPQTSKATRVTTLILMAYFYSLSLFGYFCVPLYGHTHDGNSCGIEKSNNIGAIRWETDDNMEAVKEEKQLNLNSYATKKTISQGLIDVTLLSSNAGTLNFVLKVGRIHRFYSFLLWAIYASIFIQLLQMLLYTLLARLNITKRENQTYASTLNDCILYTNGILILINGFISAFELKDEYSSRAYRSDNMTNSEFSWNETTTLVPIPYLPG